MIRILVQPRGVPATLFTPLPVATGTDQNQVVIERLAEILFTGASISWDWYSPTS